MLFHIAGTDTNNGVVTFPFGHLEGPVHYHRIISVGVARPNDAGLSVTKENAYPI